MQETKEKDRTIQEIKETTKGEEEMKLKTLKDMNYVDEAGFPFDAYQFVEELKKEAIKWVKDCWCQGFKIKRTKGCEQCYKMREFFNITEEDLK